MDTSHPDLAGKVLAQANFTAEADADRIGHGTHVAATLAGSGAASGGANRGVAPGASLLSGKVCTITGCALSAIIEGMEWAVAQGADVVNLSLGGSDSFGVDPLEAAINNLTASTGTLFVVAAGNTGGRRSVGSPASADAALAVGAVDGADQLASFSSQGPRLDDSALKPDLTAPGVDVTAARAAGSFLPGGSPYATLSGTSMATPHVAGAAAILAQRHPGWSADLLKSALLGSASPSPDLDAYAQGAGRLEVAEALDQQVTAQPASVSLGLVARDTTPGETVTRTVTYRNHGPAGVTLSVAVDAAGPGGDPAPAGMFTLDAGSVAVPAGGEASVTLVMDLDRATAAGTYTGSVTATGGGTEVRTGFGAEFGAKLTLTHTGRTGGEPTTYRTIIGQVGGPFVFVVSGQPDPATVWVPAGTYLVTDLMIDAGPGGVADTLLTIPRLEADGPVSLDFDARVAEEVEITVPDAAAVEWFGEVGTQLTIPDQGRLAITTGIPGADRVFTGHVGPDPWVPGFTAKVSSVSYVPGPGGDERNAPAAYHLGWFVENRMPTGFVRNVTAANLATVEGSYAAHRAGTIGFRNTFTQPGGDEFGSGSSVGLPFDLPFTRTEYYLSENNVRWERFFDEHTANQDAVFVTLYAPAVHYPAGATLAERWNRPVYGPAVATPTDEIDWVSRIGDTMLIELPLFGDADGHGGIPTGTPTGNNATARVSLAYGGQTIYEAPWGFGGQIALPVPHDYGTYRLTATSQRAAPVELSTEVNAEWTFSSASVSGGWPLRMPLWSVTMAPSLDANHTAPAGEVFTIPLAAKAQPSSPASGLRDLTLEFSVDDGATWQPATVAAAGGGGHVAELTHPDLTGYVSLRVTASDWSGNAVEQEVIRAYRIAPAL